MKKVNSLQLLISFLLVSLSLGCTADQAKNTQLPYYNEADFTPEWIDESAINFNEIHTIEQFELTDQNGRLITNKSLAGKIYVADFFFTLCPGICPKMTKNMGRIQEEFIEDDKIKLVSHSVMPWADSVTVLKEYADLKGINSDKWHLLTGPQNAIYNLARQSYFAEKELGLDKESNEFLHTENFILIDGKGRIRGVYNGTLSLEMNRLITDIKTLKKFG